MKLWIFLALGVSVFGADPVEWKLWPGKAPGSENWTVPESITDPGGNRVATNVSDPTLTVFLPDAAKANGAAIVIAPGGALQALSLDTEGTRVAEWLNSKGIAAFVLKYRLRQQQPGAPSAGGPPAGGTRQEMTIVKGNANPAPGDAVLDEVLRMGTADAQQALRLVRKNAAEWRVDPKRVGLMGFSAGGGVSVGAVVANEPGASADFLISLYGPSLQDVNVPANAPPLFIAVGSNHFNVTNGCLALFAEWKKAGKPAEIHVYDQVNAGFAMSKRGVPVDTWPDRLLDWMQLHKVLNP
ncbi:MAG: dienelactone hydrolase family protein [Acidobacteriota bacterium]